VSVSNSRYLERSRRKWVAKSDLERERCSQWPAQIIAPLFLMITQMIIQHWTTI